MKISTSKMRAAFEALLADHEELDLDAEQVRGRCRLAATEKAGARARS